MDATALPRFAIVAAGAMGSAVAKRLTTAGCVVYTHLNGRSGVTHQRAKEARMVDASLADIMFKANWILSILPPRDAVSFAEKIRDAAANQSREASIEPLVSVDCIAVNPETVERIVGIFGGTGVKFIDASIIGNLPKDNHDPTFYASAAPKDRDVLDAFAALSKYGLKLSTLTGECRHGRCKCAQSVACSESSILDISLADSEQYVKGITKGTIGLYTTMILAAHASSPAISEALMKELSLSQAGMLERLVKTLPTMPPKAYRWVGEMEEMENFVGQKEGDIYRGLARIYERVEKSLNGGQVNIEILRKVVEHAKRVQKE